jgi:hypothetical protein
VVFESISVGKPETLGEEHFGATASERLYEVEDPGWHYLLWSNMDVDRNGSGRSKMCQSCHGGYMPLAHGQVPIGLTRRVGSGGRRVDHLVGQTVQPDTICL